MYVKKVFVQKHNVEKEILYIIMLYGFNVNFYIWIKK